MVKFSQLHDTASKEFQTALEIYSDSFPSNERHPIDLIKERVRTGLNIAYIGRLDNEIVFIALLWPLKNTNFILLDYMATSTGFRGKNIGSDFMEHMREILERDNKRFILEVENPGYGGNKKEREKRVAFYRKNGAKELKDVKYVLPPLQGSMPTEMLLMIFPSQANEKIDSALVRNLITQIYKELYNRDATELIDQSTLFATSNQVETT